MTTNNFVPALLEMRKANPDEVMKRLHEMYLAITKLSADEVVAAFQTVDAVAEAMNLSQDRMVQNLFKALKAQMTFLVSQICGDKYRERFFEVTGDYRFKKGPFTDLF